MSYVLAFIAALPAFLMLALKVGVIVGLFGSLLEEIGKRFGFPRLVAFGQQIEAIAVDVPKVVSRVQAYDIPGLVRKALALFGKAPLAVLLCFGLTAAPALTGCASLKPALSAVANDSAIAYRAAGAALAVADVVNASYMDSIEHPTQADADRATAITAALVSIQKKLDEVKVNVANGRDKLREAVSQLKDATALLGLAGVKVPAVLADSLAEADRVLQ